MTCISCIAIAPYEQQAFVYADKVFKVLAPSCKNALLAGIITLVAWELLIKGVLKSNLDIRDLAYKLLIGLFYYALLETQGMFLEYVIEPIKASTVQIAQTIITQGNFVAVEQIASIASINEALEKAIWQILEYSQNLFARSGLFSPGPIIDGMLLCAPLLFAWSRFAFISMWFALVMAAIYAISPVLILFSIFPATRTLLISGVKIVFQGSFRLFFALLFIGLCIASIKSFCEHNWFSGAQQNNSGLLFTGSFLACFLNGVITCKLLNYTNSLAATLIGGLHHVPGISLNLGARRGLMQILKPKTKSPTPPANNPWTSGGMEKNSLNHYTTGSAPSAAIPPKHSGARGSFPGLSSSVMNRSVNPQPNSTIKPPGMVNSSSIYQPMKPDINIAGKASNNYVSNASFGASYAKSNLGSSSSNNIASSVNSTNQKIPNINATGKTQDSNYVSNAGVNYSTNHVSAASNSTANNAANITKNSNVVTPNQADVNHANSSPISPKLNPSPAPQSMVERRQVFAQPIVEHTKTYYPATKERQ